MSRARAVAGAATSPASDVDERLSLLRFGVALYDAYTSSVNNNNDKSNNSSSSGKATLHAMTPTPTPRSDALQLARLADYMHHFGFVPEQCTQPPHATDGSHNGNHDNNNNNATTTTRTRNEVGDAHAPFTHVAVADDAAWGCARALCDDADAHCAAVGAMLGACSNSGGDAVATVARALAAPYEHVTWRQDAVQCAMKKARCVYMWLCTHVQLVAVEDADDDDDDNDHDDGAAAAARGSGGADNKRAGTRSSSSKHARAARGTDDADARRATGNNNTPRNKRRGGGGAATDGHAVTSSSSRAAATGQATTMTTTHERVCATAVADAEGAALRRRRATPATMAALYARMLQHIGVTAVVVRGQLKLREPEAVVPWHWNVLTMAGRRYLVDVAASCDAASVLAVCAALRRGDGADVGDKDTAAGDALTTKTTTAAATAVTTKKSAHVVSTTTTTATAASSAATAGAGKKATRAAASAATVASSSSSLLAWLPTLTPTHTLALSPTRQRGAVECFYFCTHPAQFVTTHLPDDDDGDALSHTLLRPPTLPSRRAWLTAACVTHAFYRFASLQLHSHHRSRIDVRCTPLTLTLVNTDPAHTELCCVVYAGPLSTLRDGHRHRHDTNEHDDDGDKDADADTSRGKDGKKTTTTTSNNTNNSNSNNSNNDNSSSSPTDASSRQQGRRDAAGATAAATAGVPLGDGWVWHERHEHSNLEHFVILTPASGVYSVVIGARHIRSNPYDASIVDTVVPRRPRHDDDDGNDGDGRHRDDGGVYTPVVYYEVNVAVALVCSPVLPRVHVSPCICKLLQPRRRHLGAGAHDFVVMPSCSNVAALAVVVVASSSSSTTTAAASAHTARSISDDDTIATTTAAVALPQATKTAAGEATVSRQLRRFLRFVPERCCYEGRVELHAGECVEVWLLYAAPDRNGLTHRERVRATNDEQQQQHARRHEPSALPMEAAGAAASRTGTSSGHATSAAAAGKRVRQKPPSMRAARATSPAAASAASSGGGGMDAGNDAQAVARLRDALARGGAFVPFVTHIEVRRFVSRDVDSVLPPPTPCMAAEQAATLRRLVGVTSELYDEVCRATATRAHTRSSNDSGHGTVGSFFDARASHAC